MEFVNRGKREKLCMASLSQDTIPAGKAGGKVQFFGAGPAVWEWFMLAGAGEEVFLLDHQSVWRISPIQSGAPLAADAAASLIQEAAAYADVPQRILAELLEAERLASPGDFTGVEYDMGIAEDYVPRLRQVWIRNKQAAP